MNAAAKVGPPSMVVNKGPPHPLQSVIEAQLRAMKDQGVDIRSVALTCRKNRMGGDARPGLPDGKHLVSCLSPKQRAVALDWIRSLRFGKADLERGSDGGFNKINPLEVYGRVDKTEPLCDIGSGNGFRMKLGGHSVIGHEIDMTRVAPPNKGDVRPTCEFEKNAVGRTVTSFNALSDVRMEVDVVYGRPGVHVFPDLPYLQRVGLARKDGDEFVCKDHTGAERWRDKDPGIGSPFTDGYKSVIWFHPAVIELSCKGGAYTAPVRSHGKRITDACDLAFGSEEVSYKYDGEHYRFVIAQGEGRLTAEDGRSLALDVVGGAPEVDVDLEKVGDTYYVTRVTRLQPFWPHHTLDTCEKFCEAISIVIDGTLLKLAPPERFSKDRCLQLLSQSTIDGLVLKRENGDHLLKAEQSIDVPDGEPFHLYVEAAREAGYRLSLAPGTPSSFDDEANTTEYVLRRQGPDVVAHYKKRRYKARWDDPGDMVRYLEWPTMFTYITEQENLQGF